MVAKKLLALATFAGSPVLSKTGKLNRLDPPEMALIAPQQRPVTKRYRLVSRVTFYLSNTTIKGQKAKQGLNKGNADGF